MENRQERPYLDPSAIIVSGHLKNMKYIATFYTKPLFELTVYIMIVAFENYTIRLKMFVSISYNGANDAMYIQYIY